VGLGLVRLISHPSVFRINPRSSLCQFSNAPMQGPLSLSQSYRRRLERCRQSSSAHSTDATPPSCPSVMRMPSPSTPDSLNPSLTSLQSLKTSQDFPFPFPPSQHIPPRYPSHLLLESTQRRCRPSPLRISSLRC
jgi:hypothetical protein